MALTGKAVCWHHGGRSNGGNYGPRDLTAMYAGRARWWAQWRENGDRNLFSVKGRRRWEPIEIARARLRVNEEIAAIEARAAEPGTPAAMFDELRLLSLKMARHILTLPNGLDDFGGDADQQHKRLVLQARMTESIISDSIKVDDNALRHQERADTLSLIRERMAAVKLPEKPE